MMSKSAKGQDTLSQRKKRNENEVKSVINDRIECGKWWYTATCWTNCWITPFQSCLWQNEKCEVKEAEHLLQFLEITNIRLRTDKAVLKINMILNVTCVSWMQFVTICYNKKTNKTTFPKQNHSHLEYSRQKWPHNLRPTTTWNCCWWSDLLCEPLSLFFFFSLSLSLNERLLYHSRLQACCSRTCCHKKPLSQRVSLTATDYVWKGMFSFHSGELEGYCSICNIERWIP